MQYCNKCGGLTVDPEDVCHCGESNKEDKRNLMIINDNKVIFSTGKVLSANCGIIGLSPKDGWNVTEGYDGGLYNEDMPEEDKLTKDELIELADYMIALWQQFKNDNQ